MNAAIEPLAITAYTTVNALGYGVAASAAALSDQTGGLRHSSALRQAQQHGLPSVELDTWVGLVDGLQNVLLPPHLAEFDCRNNRLALAALACDGFATAVRAARDRYGPQRLGVFVGTSTSGIFTVEAAYLERDQNGAFRRPFSSRHCQDVFAPADLCRQYFNLHGPAEGVSSACSSGAKTFAVASRYLRAGLCDAALVGGVDSLCLTTLYGFNSLQLVSPQPCRPWDAERDGLNLGEAAGFFLLERPAVRPDARLLFSGYGESSDAHHMTAAHPDGAGALAAMGDALGRAGLRPAQIDYINLHGTATPANDLAEDKAVTRLFGTATPASSSKGWTGHTLGAAGALEAVFACLALQQQLLPGSLNTRTLDRQLTAAIVPETRPATVNAVLSNSFGFGGNNCSLVFTQA